MVKPRGGRCGDLQYGSERRSGCLAQSIFVAEHGVESLRETELRVSLAAIPVFSSHPQAHAHYGDCILRRYALEALRQTIALVRRELRHQIADPVV